MIKKVILYIMMFSLHGSILLSEEVSEDGNRARFGLWYNYGYNMHLIKELSLPFINDCCYDLKNGEGFSPFFGTLLEIPVSEHLFFGLRTGYYTQNGLFSANLQVPQMINGIDSSLSIGQKLDVTLSNISIEPYFSGEIFENFYLSFGYRFGYFIENNYLYTSTVSPEIPENIGRITRYEDNFKDVNNYDAALVFGLNYEISLNENNSFLLVPELYYSIGLSNINQDIYWKANTIRAGLALKISPEINRKMIREVYLYDTIIVYKEDIDSEYLKPGKSTIKAYETKEGKVTFDVSEIIRVDTLFKTSYLKSDTELFTDMSIYGKLAWGVVLAVNSILAKVQMTKEIYPILPYIFFEKGNSELPLKYRDNSFDISSYYPSPVKYHHNVLNIIADRLLKNPQSKISLTGYIDATTEGKNCDLAKKRAEAVKSYLVNSCNINQDRIEIIENGANCYPKNLTKAETEDRFAENRMVEISCSNSKILEPIIGSWYQKPILITPDILYFDVAGSRLDKISSWNFKLYQDKLVLKELKGGSKESIFEHKITEEEAFFLSSDKPMIAEYIGYNEIGEFSSVQKELKVFVDTADTEIESLNLVLFAVADFRVTEAMDQQIKNFISNLDKNDKVFISGYTDMLGTDDLNSELAKTRAYQIAMYINKINPDLKVESVEGVGTKRFAPGISSYSSPEERFLSRTVEIQIRRERK